MFCGYRENGFYDRMPSRKNLDEFKLNEMVYVEQLQQVAKIVRIDNHVYPFCLDIGGRYKSSDLKKVK